MIVSHEVYTDTATPITERIVDPELAEISDDIGDRIQAQILSFVRTRTYVSASISGLILLIGGLIALGTALAHIAGATQAQAVAWAFVVAAVLAGLRKWA